MENSKIIVLGSTGYIGSATVKTLAAQKANVTAGVRDISKSKELEAAGAKVVKVDMSQSQQELSSILSNYNVVYVVTPGHIDRSKLAINAIRAAKDAKINYILVLSVPTADNLDVLFGRQFNAIEKELKSSGLKFGLIRLPMFTDNIWGNVDPIKSHNSFYGPVDGSVKFNTVAIQDAALAAATILTNPSQHNGKTYIITSDLKSGDEQAQAYSKALGREIKYVNATYDGIRKAYLPLMPEWQVDGVLELYQLAEKKDLSQTILTNDYKVITGKEPTSHLAWMTQFSTVFN